MNKVLVQENPANVPMYREPPYVLGVINAPDSHYIPELYNHYKETVAFNRLDADIFEKASNSKPADRQHTPKSIKVGAVVAAVVGLVLAAKHFIFKK